MIYANCPQPTKTVLMILSEEQVNSIRAKALKKWHPYGSAVRWNEAQRLARPIEQRYKEASAEHERFMVAQAEAAAARLRERKPAGRAITPEGAAIDPRARQA